MVACYELLAWPQSYEHGLTAPPTLHTVGEELRLFLPHVNTIVVQKRFL